MCRNQQKFYSGGLQWVGHTVSYNVQNQSWNSQCFLCCVAWLNLKKQYIFHTKTLLPLYSHLFKELSIHSWAPSMETLKQTYCLSDCKKKESGGCREWAESRKKKKRPSREILGGQEHVTSKAAPILCYISQGQGSRQHYLPSNRFPVQDGASWHVKGQSGGVMKGQDSRRLKRGWGVDDGNMYQFPQRDGAK